MWWGSNSESSKKTIDFSSSLPHGLEDLLLVGDHMFTLGVPFNSDIEFRKRVVAAAKSYYMRLKSVDYTLKTYGDNWGLEDNSNEVQIVTLEITRVVKEQVINALKNSMGIEDKRDIPNLVACSAALMRLQETFQASIIMIRNGFHFEAAALQRIILEQLAWILVIHDIDYKQHNFFKIKPSSCITRLKKAFPESGILYGLLSKISHIEPKETLKYIRFKEDKVYVVMRSSILSMRDALHLLYLADIFVVLSEVVYADLISDWKNIIREADGSFSPNPDRELYKEIIKYDESIEQLERDRSRNE